VPPTGPEIRKMAIFDEAGSCRLGDLHLQFPTQSPAFSDPSFL